MEIFGTLPLPPYIKRDIEESDLNDYQTVYSKKEEEFIYPCVESSLEELVSKMELI